jgi:hypothetical protein
MFAMRTAWPYPATMIQSRFEDSGSRQASSENANGPFRRASRNLAVIALRYTHFIYVSISSRKSTKPPKPLLDD